MALANMTYQIDFRGPGMSAIVAVDEDFPAIPGATSVTLRVRCIRSDDAWVVLRRIDGPEHFTGWYRPQVFRPFVPSIDMEFDCTFSARHGSPVEPIHVKVPTSEGDTMSATVERPEHIEVRVIEVEARDSQAGEIVTQVRVGWIADGRKMRGRVRMRGYWAPQPGSLMSVVPDVIEERVGNE